MSKQEKLRLQILQKLCDKFRVKEILPTNAVFELLPNENPDDIIKELYYLEDKEYLSFENFHCKEGITLPVMVKLYSPAFDFVKEKTFTKRLLKALKSVPILAFFINLITS